MAKGRRNRIGIPDYPVFGTDIAPTVRPVPYYGSAPILGERELARSLRYPANKQGVKPKRYID